MPLPGPDWLKKMLYLSRAAHLVLCRFLERSSAWHPWREVTEYNKGDIHLYIYGHSYS